MPLGSQVALLLFCFFIFIFISFLGSLGGGHAVETAARLALPGP